MDGGKRHETPGLEEKDFMHSTAWSMVISMSVNSHEGNREGPDGWLHTQWATLQERNIKLGQMNVLQQAVSQLLFVLEADITSFLQAAYCKKSNFQLQVWWPSFATFRKLLQMVFNK